MSARAAQKKGGENVLVVCGKDAFLVQSECERLLDSLLEPDERAMSLYQPDARDIQISDVLDELRTLPFLAKKRVVFLKDADGFVSANRESLERYFDSPSPTGVLLLAVQSWPKTTRLAKKLASVGQLVEVGAMKAWQLPDYVSGYAAEHHGKKLARPAAQLLVELTGDEPGRLCSEVDKLAMFVGNGRAITVEHIESLVGRNRMFDAFEVIGSMTKGDTAGALTRLRNMFARDKNADYTVVGAFAYHFRRMFQAKALLEKGMSPQQAARQAKVWYDKEAFFAQLRKMSLEDIGKVLAELGQIDYALKTGRRQADVAIEQLVLEVAS